MRIRFGEIPQDGLRFEIKDESWFPDREIQRSGPVYATAQLKPKGVDRVLFSGTIQTRVNFACDRCLESYATDLNESFSLDLEYAPGKRFEPEEHEVSVAEMDMVYLEEPVVDIFEILKQQIFLLLPEKRLCEERCRGLCPGCGINLNQEVCDCKKDFKSSPFAVLKKR